MSSGLAIYGLEGTSPAKALEAAVLLFNSTGYRATGAGYYKRSIIDDVDDLELMEVSIDELCCLIEKGQAADFRIYSDTNNETQWSASVGFSTDQFGSFFCMDLQCSDSLGNFKSKLNSSLIRIEGFIDFTCAIMFRAKNNFDAMWYSRGENFKTIYPCEKANLFSEVALGLKSEERLLLSRKLRMIYPVNVISENHLLIKVEGVSLLDWINADPKHGSIAPVGKHWVWTVEENSLIDVNETLGRSSVLLAWSQPRKVKSKLP